MNNNASKNVTLSIIGVALLVVAVVGVSFAFFSYYGTGAANNISTGQIYFDASASGLTLTNQFPTTEAGAQTASIKVQGNTTYANGIDFRVLVTSVSDNTGGALVPTIAVNVAETLPDGVTVTPKTVTSLIQGTELASGKISTTANVTSLQEILTISAYFSKDKYHITNLTHSAENIQTLKDAGLLDPSFNGTLIQQETWNGYASGTAYSFTIQVVATEGTAAA